MHLDHRQFQRTLGPVLHSLRADLGLDAAAHLKAELQSMLVYGPGQLFTRHKDSEKEDAMMASLVVTLSSSFAHFREFKASGVLFRSCAFCGADRAPRPDRAAAVREWRSRTGRIGARRVRVQRGVQLSSIARATTTDLLGYAA